METKTKKEKKKEKMRPYKVKVEKTIQGKLTELIHPLRGGYCVKVQAFFYGGTNPNAKLHLYDAGGDEFTFPIPGQARPTATSPEISVTVRLPLSYLDEEGDNKLIVWGEIYPIEEKLTTTL